MPEIEVVYVAASRNTPPSEPPKRRALAYDPGTPLPRIGESVIIGFEPGGPRRYIVQDVAHVIEDARHGIVIRLAAPSAP